MVIFLKMIPYYRAHLDASGGVRLCLALTSVPPFKWPWFSMISPKNFEPSPETHTHMHAHDTNTRCCEGVPYYLILQKIMTISNLSNFSRLNRNMPGVTKYLTTSPKNKIRFTLFWNETQVRQYKGMILGKKVWSYKGLKNDATCFLSSTPPLTSPSLFYI